MLTATLTEDARKRILDILHLQNSEIINIFKNPDRQVPKLNRDCDSNKWLKNYSIIKPVLKFAFSYTLILVTGDFHEICYFCLLTIISVRIRSLVKSLLLNTCDIIRIYLFSDINYFNFFRPNIHLQLKYRRGMCLADELMWYLEKLRHTKLSTPKCVVYVNR